MWLSSWDRDKICVYQVTDCNRRNLCVQFNFVREADLTLLSVRNLVPSECVARSPVYVTPSSLYTVQQEIFVSENFVKSDRPAVRQEFIFVKRRSSLVALRSFGRHSVAYRLSSHS